MDQKIIDYLRVAAEDAAKSEGRPYDIRVCVIYCPDYNGCMIISKSKYQRVLRRFQFRVQRNFQKTGYRILYNGTEYKDFNLYDPNFCSVLDLYEGVDPNYSIGAVTVFNRFFSIRAFDTTIYHNPDFDNYDENEGYAIFPRKLKELHDGEIPLYPESKKGWKQFRNDLNQLYGEGAVRELPCEVFEF